MLYEIIGGSRCGAFVDVPEMPLGGRRFFLTGTEPAYSLVEKSAAMDVYIKEPMEVYLYCTYNQLILIPNKS